MIFILFMVIFSITIIDMLIHIRIGRVHKHPYWFWMSTTLLFIGLAILFLESWRLLTHMVFAVLASFFAFLAAASGLTAQKGLLRGLRRLEVGTPKEEEALLSNDVLSLKGYSDTTGTLLTKAQEMLGTETMKNLLAEHADDHIIFRGCEIEDGRLNVDAIAANVNKIKKEEQPQAMLFAFSSLNLACLETLSTVTSSETAHNVFLDTIAESARSHEIVYTQELPALLFMGMLEPFLIKCKKATIKEIIKIVEKLAEDNPVLKGVAIGNDGRVKLEGIYKRVAPLEPEERTRKIVAAFSEVMKASYPSIQASLGSELAGKLSVDVLSSLLEKYPKLWGYGLLEALPSEMELPAGYHVLKAGSYLIEEPKPIHAFEIFERLIRLGLPALCVSGIYPGELKRRYKLGDARLIWLSKQEVKGAIPPVALDILRDKIAEFTKKQRGGVTLLDGFEYLAVTNGFDQALRFLHDIIEKVAVNRATLLVPINPSAFDRRQLALLERNMEVEKPPR